MRRFRLDRPREHGPPRDDESFSLADDQLDGRITVSGGKFRKRPDYVSLEARADVLNQRSDELRTALPPRTDPFWRSAQQGKIGSPVRRKYHPIDH